MDKHKFHDILFVHNAYSSSLPGQPPEPLTAENGCFQWSMVASGLVLIKISADKMPLNQPTVKNLFLWRRTHYVFGLSVRLSLRLSEAWITLFWPVHGSVGPPDQP